MFPLGQRDLRALECRLPAADDRILHVEMKPGATLLGQADGLV
jgi:hypothetical protein